MAISVGEIEATLTLKNEMEDMIKRAQEQLKLFGKTAEETGGSWLSFGGILDEVFGSWPAKVAEGVLLRDAVHAIINEVKAGAVEFGLVGSEIDDVQTGFERLAGGTSNATEILNTMRQSVVGTITDFELMKDANKLLAVGALKNAADFGTLTDASRVLSREGFGPLPELISGISRAMETGQTRRLALMGVTVDTRKAENEYAASLGLTHDQLDKSQRLIADRKAILEALAGVTASAGVQEKSLGEMIMAASTAVKNWTNDLAMAIARSPEVKAAFEGISEAFKSAFGDDSKSMIEHIVGWVASFATKVGEYGPTIVMWLKSTYDGIVEVWHTVEKAWDVVPDWFKNIAVNAGLAATSVWLAEKAMGALGGEDIIGKLANLAQIGSTLPLAFTALKVSVMATLPYLTELGGASVVLIASLGPVVAAITGIVAALAGLAIAITIVYQAWKLYSESTDRASAAMRQSAVDVANLQRINEATGQSFTTLAEAVKYVQAGHDPLQKALRLTGAVIGDVSQASGIETVKHTENTAALLALAAAHKKTQEEALKHLETMSALDQKMFNAQRETGRLTQEQLLEIVALEKLGMTTGEIAHEMGLFEGAVKAGSNTMKELDKVNSTAGKSLDDFSKIGEHVTVKVLTLNETIEALGRAGFHGEAGLLKLGGALTHVARGLSAVQLGGIGKLVGDVATADFGDVGKKLGGSLSDGLMGVLKGIPQTIVSGLTGGGGLLGAIKGIGSQLGSALGESIGKSIAGVTGAIGETVSGISKLAGPIGAAIGSMVGPLIGMIAGLFNHVPDDIKRFGHNYGVTFSEAMIKTIQDTMKSMHLNEFGAMVINADKIFPTVTALNFAQALKLVRDGFSGVQRGDLSLEQEMTVVDQMWAKLAAAGTDAAGRWSEGIRDLVKQTEAFGGTSAAVTAAIQAQGAATLEGLNAIVAGTSSTVAGYDAVKAAVDKASKAQADLAVSGTATDAQLAASALTLHDALTAQFDAGQAATQELSDLGLQAVASFAAAVAAGMSETDALKAIHPALETLRQSYADLGMNVDDVALKNLMLQDQIVSANPQLIGAIDGLTASMVALDNMGLETVATFESQERTGFQAYTRVQAAVGALGGTTADALGQMQKYLHEAQIEAEKLGIPLDANTQMLIDQSVELGIWKDAGKSANDKLLDGLTKLLEKFDAVLNRLSGISTQTDAAARITHGRTRDMIDDWSAVASTIDEVNFGASPGGLKEIPILLNSAAMASLRAAATIGMAFDGMGDNVTGVNTKLALLQVQMVNAVKVGDTALQDILTHKIASTQQQLQQSVATTTQMTLGGGAASQAMPSLAEFTGGEGNWTNAAVLFAARNQATNMLGNAEWTMAIQEAARRGLKMASGGTGTVSQPTLFMAGEAGSEQFAFSGAGKRFSGGLSTAALEDKIDSLIDQNDRLMDILPRAIRDAILLAP